MKSVVEYFYETYGFVIQHSQWPCLQVGNQQRPNYLPMEVCAHTQTHIYTSLLVSDCFMDAPANCVSKSRFARLLKAKDIPRG